MQNRLVPARPFAFAFALVALLVSASPIHSQISLPGTWKATGPLQFGRASYTLTALENGKILIAGGTGSGGILNTAELYDPSSHTWTPSSHLMNVARSGHTATPLPDGTVLFTGGTTPQFGSAAIVCNQPGLLPSQLGISGVPTSCAELYDPYSDTFTAVGSMVAPRTDHTATLIDAILVFNSNGQLSPPIGLRVLIAGGDDASLPSKSLNSLELYDFYLQTFKALPATLATARSHHTATWLPTLDRILIAGGHTRLGGNVLPAGTAEIFDPAVNQFRTGASMASPRDGHTATALKDGTVLLAGGFSSQLLDTAEVFDPASNTFSSTPAKMQAARRNHAAVLWPDGEVLLAGGDDVNNGPLGTAELFDPSNRLFFGTTSMLNPRTNFSMMSLISGETLAPGGAFFAGGNFSQVGRAESEVYTPFQLPHITNLGSCLAQAFACQVHLHFPLILSGITHHAMAISLLPKPFEESIKDRKLPVALRIAVSGLTDAWDVAPFTEDGMPLRVARTDSKDSVVLTLVFKDADAFRAAQSSTILAFQMTAKGEPGREYPVTVKAEATSRPDLVRQPPKP